MKVKSTRKSVTKKYLFIDENEKDVEVEFKFLALSTEQGERLRDSEAKDRLDVITKVMEENLRGAEPYKSSLMSYLYSEGNVYEEYMNLLQELGKLNKDD